MHSETTATITATEITQTGYSYFTHVQIDQSLHPTGSMLSIILCLWGFLCIRDAGPSPICFISWQNSQHFATPADWFAHEMISKKYRIYSINRSGRLLNFWTLRVGAYSRWALIRGWALIKFSTFSASVVCLFCNKTINGKNKTRRCNKARFL